MAIQKLFIENTCDWQPVGNSMITEYSFDGDSLSIKWKNKIEKYPAKIGDAFAVYCFGDFPKVNPLTPPKGRGEKLLWLASFPKHTRVKREKDIEPFLNDKKELYDWWGYREYHNHESGKWHLVLCNRPDCGGVHHVAGWVSDDITNKDVKKFVTRYRKFRGFYYPDWYVSKFLKKHFDITEEATV